MNVIILEDEARAANHLERLLSSIAPTLFVVAKLESVRDGVSYLQNGVAPDLIFADVQLADGLSFDIFNRVDVRCPIIFTTAYDHYAIEAFKTNGIDYLLKPIEEERLRKAIDKVNHFSQSVTIANILSLSNLSTTKQYKERFMVKVGDKIKSVAVADITMFYSEEKATFIHTTEKRTYCVDFALDQLETMLDPKHYFRINRKYLVSIAACTNILAWTNSRLRLKIDGITDSEIIVSRERVQEFKKWLDQ